MTHAVQAVFVDGTGHIREITVADELQMFRFPRTTTTAHTFTAPPLDHTAVWYATFDRIGTLSDGRVVYGQTEAHLELWVLDVEVTEEAQRAARIDIAEVNLNSWMRQCRQPVVCLVKQATPNIECRTTRHHYEGVCKHGMSL